MKIIQLSDMCASAIGTKKERECSPVKAPEPIRPRPSLDLGKSFHHAVEGGTRAAFPLDPSTGEGLKAVAALSPPARESLDEPHRTGRLAAVTLSRGGYHGGSQLDTAPVRPQSPAGVLVVHRRRFRGRLDRPAAGA